VKKAPPTFDLAMSSLLNTFACTVTVDTHQHIGWLSFLRTLVTYAMRLRDTKALSQALEEASRHKIPMEALFCEELSFLQKELFSVPSQGFKEEIMLLMGNPLSFKEINAEVAASLSLSDEAAMKESWTYGCFSDKGKSRLYTSDGFEKAFGWNAEELTNMVKTQVEETGQPPDEGSDLDILLYSDRTFYAQYHENFSRAIAQQTTIDRPGVSSSEQSLVANTKSKRGRRVYATASYFGVGATACWWFTTLTPVDGFHETTMEPAKTEKQKTMERARMGKNESSYESKSRGDAGSVSIKEYDFSTAEDPALGYAGTIDDRFCGIIDAEMDITAGEEGTGRFWAGEGDINAALDFLAGTIDFEELRHNARKRRHEQT